MFLWKQQWPYQWQWHGSIISGSSVIVAWCRRGSVGRLCLWAPSQDRFCCVWSPLPSLSPLDESTLELVVVFCFFALPALRFRSLGLALAGLALALICAFNSFCFLASLVAAVARRDASKANLSLPEQWHNEKYLSKSATTHDKRYKHNHNSKFPTKLFVIASTHSDFLLPLLLFLLLEHTVVVCRDDVVASSWSSGHVVIVVLMALVLPHDCAVVHQALRLLLQACRTIAMGTVEVVSIRSGRLAVVVPVGTVENSCVVVAASVAM